MLVRALGMLIAAALAIALAVLAVRARRRRSIAPPPREALPPPPLEALPPPSARSASGRFSSGPMSSSPISSAPGSMPLDSLTLPAESSRGAPSEAPHARLPSLVPPEGPEEETHTMMIAAALGAIGTADSGKHLAVDSALPAGQRFGVQVLESDEQVFPLIKTMTIIGRSDASADICIEAEGVSRHHAAIICHKGTFFVVDLQSKNGTVVRGHKAFKVPIHPGDCLTVGSATLQLVELPPS